MRKPSGNWLRGPRVPCQEYRRRFNGPAGPYGPRRDTAIDAVITDERASSRIHGGRTVFDDERGGTRNANIGKQLDLFP
jgi:hypothetical protein